MQTDCWALDVTTLEPKAVYLLQEATLALLGRRDNTLRLVDRALAFDPGCVVAHGFAGFLHLLNCRLAQRVRVRWHLAAARLALRERGGTKREHALVSALAEWSKAGNMWQAAGAVSFDRQLSWHEALFHLHLGDVRSALHLHDGKVLHWPDPGWEDLANATSLLWRITSQGHDVGAARWDALAVVASERIGDHTLAFADCHHAIALAGAGRSETLERLLIGMRDRATRCVDTQARVLARAGTAGAAIAAAALQGDPAITSVLFAAYRVEMHLLGGNKAQRDLIERVAIDAAIAAGDTEAARGWLLERAARRQLGAWEARQCARLRHGAKVAASRLRKFALKPAAFLVFIRSLFDDPPGWADFCRHSGGF